MDVTRLLIGVTTPKIVVSLVRDGRSWVSGLPFTNILLLMSLVTILLSVVGPRGLDPYDLFQKVLSIINRQFLLYHYIYFCLFTLYPFYFDTLVVYFYGFILRFNQDNSFDNLLTPPLLPILYLVLTLRSS